MSRLVEQMAERTREQTAEAEGTYYEIVRRAEKPKPGDAERLAGAMRILGWPEARLQEELGILERAGALKANADRLEDLKTEQAELHEVWQAAEAAMKEGKRKCEEATAAWSAAQQATQDAHRAGEQLKELRAKHPRLLGEAGGSPIAGGRRKG